MPDSESIQQVPSPRRRRALLAAVLVASALAVGSAQGGLDAGRELLFGADAATEPAPPATGPIDLGDGRSRVPAPWRANFERFAEEDRVRPAAAGGVVFVGSSSIDFWADLPAQFPTQRVVQRGLGGATLADCVRHADRLILPSRPRVIVVYAGDNDLAAGLAPEQVAADYAALVRTVQAELPAARMVFISIKPSPSRERLMPAILRANALVAAYSAGDRRLDFVDIVPAMLDGASHVRADLFREDGLHMNADGYALWRDAIATHLD